VKPTRSEAAEASSVTTGAARLLELANTSVALARKVAGNPSAPVPLLETLAFHADKQVRRRVAANPTTPAAMLMAIGGEFPEELFDNPSLDLYLFENPNLFDGIGAAALRALLKRDRCPPSFFAYAARQDDQATHLAVLANANAPREVVELLEQSEDEWVSETAARHVALAGIGEPVSSDAWRDEFTQALYEMVECEGEVAKAHHALAYLLSQGVDELATLPWGEGQVLRVAWSVAVYPRETAYDTVSAGSVRTTIAKRLSTAQVERIHNAIASHDATGLRREFVEQLAWYPYPSVSRTLVFLMADAPPAALARAQRSPWWLERCAIAQATHVPRSVLERLTKDAHMVVRAAAAWRATRPWLPAEPEAAPEPSSVDWRAVLAAALQEADPVMNATPSEQVGKAQQTLAHLFWGYETRGIKCSRREWAVVQAANRSTNQLESITYNPATPAALRLACLHRLATSKDLSARYHLASREPLPLSVLSILAGDSAASVRWQVARNAFTSPAILERLAEDTDRSVALTVAANAGTPMAIRIALFSKALSCFVPTEWTRIAGNTATPAAVLEELAARGPGWLKIEVAMNSALPVSSRAALLESLACDESKEVRTQVAKRPETPLAVLTALSRDQAWEVRRAVAGNPLTPRVVLDGMSRDGSKRVREALATNPGLAQETCPRPEQERSVSMPSREQVFIPLRKPPAQPDRAQSLSDEKLEYLALMPELPAESERIVAAAWRDIDVAVGLRMRLLKEACAGPAPSFLRARILRLPDCPPEALSNCSTSAFWVERCVVAIHVATPDKVIAKLCRDPHPAVRAAALEQQAKRVLSAPLPAPDANLSLFTEAN